MAEPAGSDHDYTTIVKATLTRRKSDRALGKMLGCLSASPSPLRRWCAMDVY